jgi:hypothetical protein
VTARRDEPMLVQLNRSSLGILRGLVACERRGPFFVEHKRYLSDPFTPGRSWGGFGILG